MTSESDPGGKIYEARLRTLTTHLTLLGKMPFKCLLCGADDAFTFMGQNEMTTVIPLSVVGRYFPAYTLVCNGCGFAHTFDGHTVDRIVASGSAARTDGASDQ